MIYINENPSPIHFGQLPRRTLFIAGTIARNLLEIWLFVQYCEAVHQYVEASGAVFVRRGNLWALRLFLGGEDNSHRVRRVFIPGV